MACAEEIGLVGFEPTACRRGDRTNQSTESGRLVAMARAEEIGLVGFEPTACRRGDRTNQSTES